MNSATARAPPASGPAYTCSRAPCSAWWKAGRAVAGWVVKTEQPARDNKVRFQPEQTNDLRPAPGFARSNDKRKPTISTGKRPNRLIYRACTHTGWGWGGKNRKERRNPRRLICNLFEKEQWKCGRYSVVPITRVPLPTTNSSYTRLQLRFPCYEFQQFHFQLRVLGWDDADLECKALLMTFGLGLECDPHLTPKPLTQKRTMLQGRSTKFSGDAEPVPEQV